MGGRHLWASYHVQASWHTGEICSSVFGISSHCSTANIFVKFLQCLVMSSTSEYIQWTFQHAHSVWVGVCLETMQHSWGNTKGLMKQPGEQKMSRGTLLTYKEPDCRCDVCSCVLLCCVLVKRFACLCLPFVQDVFMGKCVYTKWYFLGFKWKGEKIKQRSRHC